MILRPYHLLLLSIWICLVLSEDPTSTDAPTSTAATAKTADPGIYFPVLTMSEPAIRPAAIGMVKSKSGKREVDFPFDCKGVNDGKDMDPWSGGDMHKITKIEYLCNVDSTYFNIKFNDDETNNCGLFLYCNVTTEGYCKELPQWVETRQRKDNNGYASVSPFCLLKKQPKVIPRHRWGNFEDPIRNIGKLHANTFPAPPADLYIQMPMKQEASDVASIVSDSHRFIGHLLHSPTEGENNLGLYKQGPVDRVECKDGCHFGRHILIEYKKEEMEIMVHLTGKCQWFTVCTDYSAGQGKCNFENTVNVMVRNGFVSFDSRREQALLKMVRAPRDAGVTDKKSMTRVDLTIVSGKNYETLTGDEGPSKDFSHMAVTSSWRQRVLGRINVGEKMLLTFSSPDCLHKEFGLRANADATVLVHDYEKTGTYFEDVKSKAKDNVKYEGDGATKDKISDKVIAEASTVATTLERDFTAAETTTQMITMPPMEGMANGRNTPKTTDSNDEKSKWKGQSTWAIFYGWLVGSFVAALCMVPAMFFMRRMLYANWYRGVYKRYGCDASGATGGVTGASFGDQTIGTQMGTTGGSDTSTMQTSQMSQMSNMSQISQATSTAGGDTTTGGGGSTMQTT